MKATVSICIPTYNQTEFLRKNLDSVLIQSYSDYEIIITDDTPDDTVQRLIQEYDFGGKLRYFKNKKRLGSPENWNEAIRHASGEYIKLLHHDDYFVHENSLYEYVQMLNLNPQADFALSATRVSFSNDIEKNRIHGMSLEEFNTLKTEPVILFNGNIIGAPSATIYRQGVHRPFDNNMKWLVDIDFYISVLWENANIVYSDKPLICTNGGEQHSVTNQCLNDKNVNVYEYFYLFNKIASRIKDDRLEQYLNTLWEKITQYKIKNIQGVKDCGYDGPIHPFIKKMLCLQCVSPILAKLYMRFIKIRFRL